MPGKLYLVATPIGNLQDMTFRAVETLRNVDVIACEDTRHTRKLLDHFRISNSLISYHEHNEQERAEELADRLVEDQSVAVVSDAGTPGISDPAFRIVNRAIEIGAEVVSIPGPVAFVSAVIATGLPTDSIFYGGFLPSRKGDRRRRLAEVSAIPATLVFYEAPHRLSSSLADCMEVLGDRPAAVAREITKLHEEIIRDRLSRLVKHFSGHKIKGEIVLCIGREGPKMRHESLLGTLSERVAELEKKGLERKAALKKAAREFGISRSEAYRQIAAARGKF